MMMDGDVGELNKEQKSHVATMQKIAVNLADLVQMILDVSRIQLDRVKVDLHKFDVKDLIEEILQVIEPKAQEKSVIFEKSIPKNKIIGNYDKRLTRMTLENLLSNAIKYTPSKGKVQFNVSLTSDSIQFEIRDSGCGIPKAEQGRIFEKLYRASNVRNVDGNGFGLYIAKGAIEAQRGKIWFESVEGRGTTFHIVLPLSGDYETK
jgi:signal transduction histidine kinase